MTAQIIDGKAIAAQMRQELADKVQSLKARGITPGLAVILVGEDPASRSYVSAKEKTCQEIGIYSDDNRLPAETSEKDLLALVQKFNRDPKIQGILVQLPLPKHICEDKVLLAIDPDKDVDGFHPVNVGRMVVGQKGFLPCTPHGVVQMLLHSGVKLDGAHVVIVGRSNIVGKPQAMMLLERNATVTICHSRTRDLAAHCRRADVLVAAVGRARMITGDMIKPGAVVIDVGMNREPDGPNVGKLCGDVDFASASQVASAITPVPGGVGPMTRAMLLVNTMEAAERAG